jgi:hypothetical protein
MRALNKFLGITSIFVLAAAVTGCGNDIAKSVACSTQTDCLTFAGTAYAPDASAMFLPQCCAALCVVPSVGCDSGYRYLNGVSMVGDCVAAPMCPAVVHPDMAEPGDM